MSGRGPSGRDLPDVARPALRRGGDAGRGRLRHRGGGIPSLELMERAAEGLARVVDAAAAPGPIRVMCGPGNNGGDGLAVARLLRTEGREVDVLFAGLRSRRSGATRGSTSTACRARRRMECLEGFDPALLAGSGAVVDAMLGTGFSGAPRAPDGRRDRRDQRPGRAGGGLRRALGRRRLDRRGRGRGGARDRDRHLPRAEGRASTSRPGPSTRARCEAVEIGIPRAAPRAGDRRPDRSRVLGRRAPPHPRRLEVRLRDGGRRRRGAGPDRRAVHGRPGRPADGRRLRAGRGARLHRAGVRAAPARGDDRLAAPTSTARTCSDGVERRARALRARRRARARPRALARRGRLRVRARAGPARARSRC